MAETWEPAAQVAKNDQGQFVALIGGKWEPVASASKNDAGQFMIVRGAKPDMKAQIEGDHITQGAKNFNEGKGFFSNLAAGYGGALPNLVQGAGQLLGDTLEKTPVGRPAFLPTQADVDETKKRDAPLMNTAGGFTGNMLGTAAPAALTAFIPGANTVGGAAITGAGLAALDPVATGESRTEKMALGAAGGAAGQYVGGKLAEKLQSRVAAQTAEEAARKSRDSVRDAILQAGQEAGLTVPPSAVNPSWINKRLESIAGKAAVGQEASARNQQAVNTMGKKALGMADDTPLTEQVLDKFRDVAAQPYRDVAALPTMPPDRLKGIGGYPLIGPEKQAPAEALRDLKLARSQANDAWKEYNRTGVVTAKEAAEKLSGKATDLEAYLVKTAQHAGRDDVVNALRAARTKIAKSYEVEKALNLGNGDISAPVLGRALDRGAPLSGELETIAKFQQAFPSYMREGAKIPTPGVSKSEAVVSAMLAAGGGMGAGPAGVALGALPMLSGPVRSMVLSPTYQKLMAKIPEGGPSSVAKLAAKVPQDKVEMIARLLAAPALAETAQQQ